MWIKLEKPVFLNAHYIVKLHVEQLKSGHSGVYAKTVTGEEVLVSEFDIFSEAATFSRQLLHLANQSVGTCIYVDYLKNAIRNDEATKNQTPERSGE
jgi:hypothetical protein